MASSLQVPITTDSKNFPSPACRVLVILRSDNVWRSPTQPMKFVVNGGSTKRAATFWIVATSGCWILVFLNSTKAWRS
eukprot:scaffold8469_cov69-Cylindrotheca_fusiformis.AAC.1